MRLKTIFTYLILALALCIGFNYTTPALAEESKQVTIETTLNLTDKNGKVDSSLFDSSQDGTSITLTNIDGKVSGVPAGPQITGWTFKGWYTEAPLYRFWDNDERGSNGYPTLPSGYESLNLDPNIYYWSWLTLPQGTEIKNNSDWTIVANTTTIYAVYESQHGYKTEFWMNKWNNKEYLFLTSGHDYYTKFNIHHNKETNNAPEANWEGHTFLGWADNSGKVYEENTWITGNHTLYVKWKDNATGQENQEWFIPQYSDAYNVKIVGADKRIDPNGNKESSIEAYITTDAGQYRADPKSVKWTFDNENLLTSRQDGQMLYLKGKGQTGTVKVTVTVTKKDGGTLTDSATITVDHSFDGKIIVDKYPSCTENGKGHTNCTVCGQKSSDIIWEKNGHRFTYYRTNATCTESGCEDRYCVVCGLHEHETTQQALGHSYKTTTITSCTGLTKIETCNTCGNTITIEDSSAGQHTWAATKTIDKQPTCKTEGSKSIHCLNCSVTKEVETIPITTTHNFSNWKEVVKATEQAAGREDRTCTICGVTESRVIPKILPQEIQSTVTEKYPDTTQSSGETGGNTEGNTEGNTGGNTGGSSGGAGGTPSGGTTPINPPSTQPQPDTQTPSESEKPADTPQTQPETPETVTIYRLYNEYNGGHLLTINKNEKDTLIKLGWTAEKDAGQASQSGTPVYRLYNPTTGEHFYTVNETEYNNLGSIGWQKEDVAWYSSGNVPMYRLYNPYILNGPNHLYTTDKNEYNSLGKLGWNQEDIGWYCEG